MRVIMGWCRRCRAPGAGVPSTLTLAFASALAVLALPRCERTARADEPVAPGEPHLMSETAEVTSVVDAFDEADPFDLNLMIGFEQTWKNANIRRETSLSQTGLSTGGFVSANENIASYNQQVSTLNMGADVGIYRDLAVVFRLPLILADNRALGPIAGGGAATYPQLLADPAGGTLFNVPFKSPTRSGVDFFSVGLDWALFNQQRDWTKPTWLFGVSGRFGVGNPLHACNAGAPAGQPQCIDPTNPTGPSRDPGISRAMDGLEIHTYFSRRYGYVEPYTGFTALLEFAENSSDFGETNNETGALINHPPYLGTFLAGIEVIPWERREQFQRIVGDLRVAGTYHSAGREYTELFDALGSSNAVSLRTPNPTGYVNGVATYGGSPTPNPATGVPFTGITDQQAFGSVTFNGTATWQAGEYVKFIAGLGVTFNQAHLITAADACNPNLNGTTNASGPCQSIQAGNQPVPTGIPNPNHRDVIDLPGQRFSADDTTIVNFSISGVVMF
jgi:hypothetical protein